MTMTRTLATTAAALLLTAGAAFAAPCATGTTTNAHGQSATNKSSTVDGGSDTKVSPGAKAESPGTVGALDNVGNKTQPAAGEKKPAEGKVVTGQNADDC